MKLAWSHLRIALLWLGPTAAWAVSGNSHGFVYTVEPIVGYELFQRDTPTPHRAGLLVYGARFTAGRPHLSLEGEYTHGNDAETFTSPSVMTVNTTRDVARLGVRGTYDLGPPLDFVLRAGGQASKTKVETLDASGFSSTGEGAWLLKPYAGAGLVIAPAAFVSLTLDATYVFYSLSDWTQNSIQLVAGLRLHAFSR